jgi:hypothetical protein
MVDNLGMLKHPKTRWTGRFVNALTVPKSVGPGRILYHNYVRHSLDMPCGVNGFRGWTDVRKLPGFRRCHCGWSGLPHYSKSPDYQCEPMEVLERRGRKRGR